MQAASFMKSAVLSVVLPLLFCVPVYAAGGIDINAGSIGAVNSPASGMTTYVSSAPAIGETVLLVAEWAGQSLTATVSDGTADIYTSIVGPINMAGGIIRAQAWYCVNAHSPTAFTISLSGNSISGAFDGILLAVISLTGLKTTSPLDTATVNSATGSGPRMSVTSGIPSQSGEMVLGIFLGQVPETPWTAGSGWTSITGQEAVSLFEYQNITSGGAQTATAAGNVSNNWLGFIFGFYPAF